MARPLIFTGNYRSQYKRPYLRETMQNVHSGQSGMRNMVGYIMMFCTDAVFCYICMKAELEEV